MVDEVFADPASGWLTYDNNGRRVAYEDNAYVISLPSQPDTWVMATDGRRLGDVVIQVDLDEPEGTPVHPFGVFVRAQDRLNFHGIIVATDESYAIFHMSAGTFSLDSVIDARLPAGIMDPDGPNRLTVATIGDEIRLYMNGEEIADPIPALWEEGVAGAVAIPTELGASAAIFDNWTVWILDGGSGDEVSAPDILTAAALATEEVLVNPAGFPRPPTDGYNGLGVNPLEASAAIAGMESSIELRETPDGDRLGFVSTNGREWAVLSLPLGNETLGFMLRDPDCSGRLTERLWLDAPLEAPACALAGIVPEPSVPGARRR
jgi:hypothetical protein